MKYWISSFFYCLQLVGFYTIKPDITINERRCLWNHPPCLSFSQTGSIHSLSVSSKSLLRSERRARGARQSKENKLCVILRASNTCGMAVTDAPLITLLKFLMEYFFFLCKSEWNFTVQHGYASRVEDGEKATLELHPPVSSLGTRGKTANRVTSISAGVSP